MFYKKKYTFLLFYKWFVFLNSFHFRAFLFRNFQTGTVEFDDSMSTRLLPGEKPRNKKDIGTTTYKKPGPPTPSKNGGRLSMQGNEVHPRDHNNESKTPKRTTPSRLKALFMGKNSSVRDNSEVGRPILEACYFCVMMMCERCLCRGFLGSVCRRMQKYRWWVYFKRFSFVIILSMFTSSFFEAHVFPFCLLSV